ncbi:hypothetical protein TNCV_3884471 [Trichonephila clavipes]|nr:hypothetical protein TNCV_3884471 [Trichonephila clavipes]
MKNTTFAGARPADSNCGILIIMPAKVPRLQFGSLLNATWGKVDTAGNGTSWFSATGIYPYNPQAITHHVFAISDGPSIDNAVPSTSGAWSTFTTAGASTTSASGSGLSPLVA